MDISSPEPVRPVGPVLQFALLIAPVVMNGFFVVYALTGWLVSGRDRLNWSLEAPGVALWVGLGMSGFAALVIGFTRLSGGTWRHPLILSSVCHGALALLLAVLVLIAARTA